MRWLILLLVSFTFGCSTTPEFRRDGYSASSLKANPSECHIAIQYQAKLTNISHKVLGKIEASDSGLSVQCQQDNVLNQFYREACGLDANLINIVTEQFPDFWSTCYRAKAEFISVQTKSVLVSDKKYKSTEVEVRSQEGRQREKMLEGTQL